MTFHDHIVIQTSQIPFPVSPSHEYYNKTALQYTAVNIGMRCITFSIDFTASHNIHVYQPHGRGKNTVLQGPISTKYCWTLYPFDRQAIAYIIKPIGVAGKSYIKVEFKTQDEKLLDLEASRELQQQQLQNINAAYQSQYKMFHDASIFNNYHLKSKFPMPRYQVSVLCDDINRYFSGFIDPFIDLSFPPTPSALFETTDTLNSSYKFNDSNNFKEKQMIYTWRYIDDIVDTSWCFMTLSITKDDLLPVSTIPNQDVNTYNFNIFAPPTFLGALNILEPIKNNLQPKWFPQMMSHNNDGLMQSNTVQVNICKFGVYWIAVYIDLYLPAPVQGSGCFSCSHISGEIYRTLLHKAYAKVYGNYEAVLTIPTVNILYELTGKPWVQLYPQTYNLSSKTDEAIDGKGERKEEKLGSLLIQLFRQTKVNSNLSSDQNNMSRPILTVSFEKLDKNLMSFPILNITADSKVVELGDTFDMISNHFIGQEPRPESRICSRPFNVVQLEWDQFVSWDPKIDLLLHQHVYEMRKRKIFQFSCDRTFEFAFSLRALSSIIISANIERLARDKISKQCHSAMQQAVELALTSTGPTYELRLISLVDDHQKHTLPPTKTMYNKELSLNALTKRVSAVLSAGEYLLQVRVSCTSHSQEESIKSEMGNELVMSVETLEENLNLLFMLLDQDMDGFISYSELTDFLSRYEGNFLETTNTFLSQDTIKQICGATNTNDERSEYKLTLEDFSCLFQLNGTFENNHEDIKSGVWVDLCTALHFQQSNSVQIDLEDPSTNITNINLSSVYEFVLCIQSDVNLVDLVMI